MKKQVLCALLALGLIVVTMSVAKAQPTEKHVSLVDLEKRGYTVEFLGNAYGVDGWLIRDKDGRIQYAYSTPEGGLITGLLFAPDGSIYTVKQTEKFRDVVKEGSQDAMTFKSELEKSNAPLSEKIYAEIEKTKYFAVGDKDAPYIYTFMNPTCEHCVTFWVDHMQKVVADGKLQIRFIPFGATDKNREAAALLLMADDAGEIWKRYAAGDKTAYDRDIDIPAGIYDAVDVNTALFNKHDLKHIPFSIYRAPADGEIKVIAGIPKNTMMVLADFIE